MKLPCTRKQTGGMTLIEVIVVATVLALLVAMILPALTAAKRGVSPSCMNNLKQIGLAYKIWAGDNGDKYPMQVSVTNGGTMELFSSGSRFSQFAFLNFVAMANELGTPKLLHCPADTEHLAATNFSARFSGANISYFFNVDASDSDPQTILTGDDNLTINSVRVEPGILNLSTNSSVTWTKERHHGAGNIGLADGSVQSITSDGLQPILGGSALSNRLLIP